MQNDIHDEAIDDFIYALEMKEQAEMETIPSGDWDDDEHVEDCYEYYFPSAFTYLKSVGYS